MNAHYEVAFSSREPLLRVILLKGTWESLPFEVRLAQPWRGSAPCPETALTDAQREEVAIQGYCVDHASSAHARERHPPAKPIAVESRCNMIHGPVIDGTGRKPRSAKQRADYPRADRISLTEAAQASLAENREILNCMRRACLDLRETRKRTQSLLPGAYEALRAANQLLHERSHRAA